MSRLRLGGRTQQRVAIAQPPDVAFRYFAGNEELLRSFLGEDRVQFLGDGVYRVRLNPHGALGLTLQPTFDVQFVELPPDRVEMRSLRAALAESTHADAELDARFTGEAVFEPAPGGCTLACWAEMQVELGLPAVLRWMPTAPLEALGNGIIQAAMNGLSVTLGPILNIGLERAVAQQKAPLP